MLTVSPAVACHYCGSYGGYYPSDYSYSGYYNGGYYDSGCYGCGGNDCGYVESCCGGEVVVSDCCGGGSDCGCAGCGCDDCGGCADCGPSGTEIHGEMAQGHAPADDLPLKAAPTPPAMRPNHMGPEHSTVNRPATEPIPMLPPEPMHDTTDTEMHALPPSTAPADRYEPSRATTTPAPAAEPVTPPADSLNDLFGAPPAVEKPLPVEEPATPAESDDFFSSPAAAPAVPATEPSSSPLDDDLFGPPSEATPAEDAAPPADEETTEDDDLFGKAQTILEMPGGLASHTLRRWVDNTGAYSVRGRLIRVLDGKVQLLKDNGRTTTVPISRLSQADFQFVARQASAQKAEAISKTARVSTHRSN
jgi:hypothetical protein